MAKAKASPVRIIENHDYMSLVTPNGRFTMGYGGEKASGNLAAHPTAFREMRKFVNDKVNNKEVKSFGEAFKMLADEKILTKLFPEWNMVETNPYKGDGTERVQMIEKYAKKYGPGTIVEVKKLNVYVKFDSQPNIRTQMDFKLVELLKK